MEASAKANSPKKREMEMQLEALPRTLQRLQSASFESCTLCLHLHLQLRGTCALHRLSAQGKKKKNNEFSLCSAELTSRGSGAELCLSEIRNGKTQSYVACYAPTPTCFRSRCAAVQLVQYCDSARDQFSITIHLMKSSRNSWFAFLAANRLSDFRSAALVQQTGIIVRFGDSATIHAPLRWHD